MYQHSISSLEFRSSLQSKEHTKSSIWLHSLFLWILCFLSFFTSVHSQIFMNPTAFVIGATNQYDFKLDSYNNELNGAKIFFEGREIVADRPAKIDTLQNGRIFYTIFAKITLNDVVPTNHILHIHTSSDSIIAQPFSSLYGYATWNDINPPRTSEMMPLKYPQQSGGLSLNFTGRVGCNYANAKIFVTGQVIKKME
jgi:hypothetical protein